MLVDTPALPEQDTQLFASVERLSGLIACRAAFVHEKLLLGTMLVLLSAAQSCSNDNRGADGAPVLDAADDNHGGTGGVYSNRSRDASYADSRTDYMDVYCYVPPMGDGSNGRGGSGGKESNDSSTEDDGGSEFDDDSDAGSDD